MTVIREARPEDIPDVLRLIHGLAAYEREPGAVRTTPDDLLASLFPAHGQPLAHCHVAQAAAGVVGIALWFVTFSTWEGRHGIHLEDLYVQPDHRGAGVGRALVAALAAEAVRRGYPRLEWSVLDWNSPARDFYGALGGQPMTEWIPYRLSDDALRRLAQPRATAP